MNKKFLNLMIAACLLFTAVNVQAQSGDDEPTPPPDSTGMILQDGVLTANPLPRATEPAMPDLVQGEGSDIGYNGMLLPPEGSAAVEQPAAALAAPTWPSWSGQHLPIAPEELQGMLEDAPGAPELAMGGGDPCKPSHLVNINFDELAAPPLFEAAVALRYEYRAQGLMFRGSSAKDGGAVLNSITFGSISGYSPPNILAFNTNIEVVMSDGGIPSTPETIGIMGKATYFTMNVAAPTDYGAGSVLYMWAYGENMALLGSTSMVLSNSMQPLAISYPGITFITFETTAPVLVVDDISYLPETIAQVIDFDENVQPFGFPAATPLRTDYSTRGVRFAGPSALDGGAILDESSSFGVSGYSSPNFLAFNATSSMANGGIPRPPEEIRFNMPVSLVQVYLASHSSAGTLISVTAYDRGGNVESTAQIKLDYRIQPVTVTGSQITRVVVATTANAFILDDLIYRPENAVHIDFDETVTHPALFKYANPLRDEMISCGVTFQGEAPLDGGAILNDATFGSIGNRSTPNSLAFNANAPMANGGIPKMPEMLTLSQPASYVEFYAGSPNSGVNLYAFGYGTDNTLVAGSAIVLSPDLQPVRLTGSQPIQRILITTTEPLVLIDDIFYTRDPWLMYLPNVLR